MSRKQRIETVLTHNLNPLVLTVEDESSNHHVPEGSESHFKVTVVSASFHSVTRVARHRLVNKLLADELQQGLHALSMHLFTPEEWSTREEKTSASPACRDGLHQGGRKK